ncbi:histidine--tRNA ligase [Candidatus Saccharibacteria bacterium]|nr:histidine--tRNA ligase [Candidatus Saccharibacteria bacterium]
MKRINTSPISGMQELLPPQQAVFNQIKNQIETIYHLHGFQSIETPIIDRTSILLAKAGGDTEKQIYKVIKTEESADDADQALRFDHTVPLARYVIEHENDLAFPFKVTQIGRNFRGERAQKGRFREFYQCDIDILGRDTLPIAYDVEVITTLYEALQIFNLPEMRIRISNRKILTGLLAALNLQDFSADIFSIIDHAEKVPPETTREHLENLNLSPDIVDKITTFMQISGSREEVINQLQNLGIENEIFATGLSELSKVLEILAQNGLGEIAIADMLIVRGLDYYTGTVFETFLTNHRHIGSICGGGRYDNLTGFFSDHKFPGVGGSIGLTRLFYVLNENNLLNSQIINPVDYAIIPMSENEYKAAYNLTSKLRGQGKTADIILTDKKLGDKLNYAGKIAKYAVVVGETEAAAGKYQVKNLETREQFDLAL